MGLSANLGNSGCTRHMAPDNHSVLLLLVQVCSLPGLLSFISNCLASWGSKITTYKGVLRRIMAHCDLVVQEIMWRRRSNICIHHLPWVYCIIKKLVLYKHAWQIVLLNDMPLLFRHLRTKNVLKIVSSSRKRRLTKGACTHVLMQDVCARSTALPSKAWMNW